MHGRLVCANGRLQLGGGRIALAQLRLLFCIKPSQGQPEKQLAFVKMYEQIGLVDMHTHRSASRLLGHGCLAGSMTTFIKSLTWQPS